LNQDPVSITRQEDGTFQLQTSQWLPRSIDDVFAFFADARNLQAITPGWLHFHIENAENLKIEAGTRINYRLRLHGIPLRWQSRISVWEPTRRFVDEQVHGPYRRWVHEHRFEVEGTGTRIDDTVDYAVPGGALVHWLFVAGDLRRIFAYRGEKVAELLAAR
jgi:ligand-binding SRPBCC domain-containing protein